MNYGPKGQMTRSKLRAKRKLHAQRELPAFVLLPGTTEGQVREANQLDIVLYPDAYNKDIIDLLQFAFPHQKCFVKMISLFFHGIVTDVKQ